MDGGSDSHPRRPQFPARPTVYKGIRMRSRLEAGFAQWLDGHGFVWEYEPHTFASDAGQYLPDFMVDGLQFTGSVSRAWVEVKPASFTDLFGLAASMAVICDSDTWSLRVLQIEGRDPLLHAGDTWLPLKWVHVAPINWTVWKASDSRLGHDLVVGHSQGSELCVLDGQCGNPEHYPGSPVRTGSRVGLAAPAQLPWPDGYWNAGSAA